MTVESLDSTYAEKCAKLEGTDLIKEESVEPEKQNFNWTSYSLPIVSVVVVSICLGTLFYRIIAKVRFFP